LSVATGLSIFSSGILLNEQLENTKILTKKRKKSFEEFAKSLTKKEKLKKI